MLNIYWTGLIIGIIAFLSIGLFHPIVIWAEYYFTKKIWPAFFVIGIVLVLVSLLVKNMIISAGLGVLGLTCLWSVGELFEQEKRVQKGWFPKHPNRK